jgi:hypothetical protein
MLSWPEIGTRVRIRYGSRTTNRASYLHDKIGTVVALGSKKIGRRHTIEVDGVPYAIPPGNLFALDDIPRAEPAPSTVGQAGAGILPGPRKKTDTR